MSRMRHIQRSLATSRAGIVLRDLLNIRPPVFYPRMSESVSDLFLWRNDEVWETWFDLMPIAGTINPDIAEDYDVLMCIYDAKGDIILRNVVRISPNEVRRIRLGDLLTGLSGFGTFAIFHQVDNHKLFGKNKTCLAETGYLSFRRKTDDIGLRSYVHGNMTVAGMDQRSGAIRKIGVRSLFRRYFYQPQVLLDDCAAFDVCVVNPTDAVLKFELEFLDANNHRLYMVSATLSQFGSFCYLSSGAVTPRFIRLHSRTRILRPVLFKYYASHFDVFHA